MSGIVDCTGGDGVEAFCASAVDFHTVGDVGVVVTVTTGDDVGTVTAGVMVAVEAGTRSFGLVGSVDASEEKDDLRACSS